MNDHHKLRIWNKTKNKMLYFDTPFDARRPYTETSTLPQYQSCKDYHDVEEMGCSGLKDKYRRLIYEGDIVRIGMTCQDKYSELVVLVNYHPSEGYHPFHEHFGNSSGFLYDSRIGEFNLKTNEDTWPVEIIGNIYENPELVKL